MKNLQNNFTTPEQSKRLLELGVPVWTADGQYNDFNGDILVLPDLSVFSPIYENNTRKPCWSVGRLIEIELLCREKRDGHIARLYFLAEKDPIDADTIGCSNIIEGLIRYMESALYKYDFSNLNCRIDYDG